MTAKLIEIVYEGRQGDKEIRKPKELLNVKPLFHIRYGSNKAYRVEGVKCQVYIDNNDIWIRHGMWVYSNGVAWIKMNNLLSYKPSIAIQRCMAQTLEDDNRFNSGDLNLFIDIICKLDKFKLFKNPDIIFKYKMSSRGDK